MAATAAVTTPSGLTTGAAAAADHPAQVKRIAIRANAAKLGPQGVGIGHGGRTVRISFLAGEVGVQGSGGKPCQQHPSRRQEMGGIGEAQIAAGDEAGATPFDRGGDDGVIAVQPAKLNRLAGRGLERLEQGQGGGIGAQRVEKGMVQLRDPGAEAEQAAGLLPIRVAGGDQRVEQPVNGAEMEPQGATDLLRGYPRRLVGQDLKHRQRQLHSTPPRPAARAAGDTESPAGSSAREAAAHWI